MLKFLKIQNFAIIKQSEVDFSDGLNVISGETGSGKSIVLKALKFVLGARGDKSAIRDNCAFTKVQATFFDYQNEELLSILNDFGIDVDEQLIISRTMHIDGKNDIGINGSSVTLNMLNKVTNNLVDIYNQEEHFSLLDVKKHLKIIDAFDYVNIEKIKTSLENIINEIKEIDAKLYESGANLKDKEREIDLLQYQIDEIQNNIFTDEEYDELINKKKVYANIKKITEYVEKGHSIIDQGYNGYSLSSAIKEAQVALSNLYNIDNEYEKLNDRLDNIKFELNDIDEILSDKLSELDVSDSEIDAVEERLEIIKTLKKKYGEDLNSINKTLNEFKDRLNFIQNNEQVVKELNEKRELLIKQGVNLSKELTGIRKNISKNFSTKIVTELADLGMKNSRFEVNFKNYVSINDLPFNKDGQDNVEFIFSANRGQDLKPLNKIISGGELSRFMLAYKNVAHEFDKKDLLVFDEIDAGISGSIGQQLAIKLHKISKECQIVSISHLPQIISMAKNNYLVEKHIVDDQTQSFIKQISGEDLLKEVSRVSGNGEVSETNIKLAQELIEKAKEFKNSEK